VLTNGDALNPPKWTPSIVSCECLCQSMSPNYFY